MGKPLGKYGDFIEEKLMGKWVNIGIDGLITHSSEYEYWGSTHFILTMSTN